LLFIQIILKKTSKPLPFYVVSLVLPLALDIGSFEWSFYAVLILEKDHVFRGREVHIMQKKIKTMIL